jgi:hypothetical protein
MATYTSRGKTLWDTFRDNLRAYQFGPAAGSGTRQIIWGVSAKGTFVGGMTADAFIAQAGKVLLDSGRVYRWENTLCFEVDEDDDKRLVILAGRHKAEPHAGALLSNLFCVGVRGQETASQSLPSPNLVNALLADQQLWRMLPAVRCYSRRPVFDQDFNLCGPGWNAEQGVLVHGPDVTPEMAPASTAATRTIDRLPPYTRGLFKEFCWGGEADLSNAVALLLTGFLANHFVDDPKPVAILDGNQRGVGKTLLVQAVGRVLDGIEPRRLPLARDEELEKKLGAALHESRSGIFFFDNVQTRIQSALIEANALSPVLSFRILGRSANITRPNDYLWVITSNQTSGTEDLISRGLPIRLHYEGNPRERSFITNLLDYVTRYRLEILGELAGMVLRWKQAGMPRGTQKHRCVRWAEVIGGILAVAGVDQFLGNVEEAEAVMDEGLLALSGLAEHLIGKDMKAYFVAEGASLAKETGMLPKDWTRVFLDADVSRDKLAEKSPKGRDTWVGTFLSGKTDRKVTVSVAGGVVKATLRKNAVRGDQKRYYFEVTNSDASGGAPAPAGGARNASADPTPVAPVPTPGSATSGPANLPPEGMVNAIPTPPAIEAGNDLVWV